MGKVRLLFGYVVFGFGGAAAQAVAVAPSLTAAEIMQRVAANQDSAESARRSYVYLQHARVASRKGSKVMCEEITDSRVTPTEKGSHQQLLSLKGTLLVKGKPVQYTSLPGKDRHASKPVDTDDKPPTQTPGEAGQGRTKPAPPAQEDAKSQREKGTAQSTKEEIDNDSDMDRDMVENMRDHIVNDTSKDGIGGGLFPLTSKNQKEYVFRLIDRTRMNGHDTYHLEFEPRDREDYTWKGEAYIDAEAFQPVFVRTNLSRKIPMAVRVLLGTNVPGLGFGVSYEKQPDGLWFPQTFGTEFKVHVLFFLRRDIVISVRNSDFEKTHTKAKVIDPRTGQEVPSEPDEKPRL